MQLPEKIEVKGTRVITTRQLTEWYKAEEWQIKQNFRNNKEYFKLGKHYISLQGEDLKYFKSKVENIYLVGKTAKILYLWTEKGALLHAKSLNTDKAWEAYDYLVDFYFHAKENQEIPEPAAVVPTKTKTEPVKKKISIPHMEEPIFIFKNLLDLAEEQGILLKIKDIRGYESILKGNRIAIRKNMAFEQVVYEAAYELAHYFIHYDKGNMIDSPLSKDYNEQAERAAIMMIRMLDIKYKQRY